MTDFDQLLARIDTTLTHCDATTLPPLTREGPKPPPADPEVWPAPRLVEDQALVEASPSRTSRLLSWLHRRAQP